MAQAFQPVQVAQLCGKGTGPRLVRMRNPQAGKPVPHRVATISEPHLRCAVLSGRGHWGALSDLRSVKMSENKWSESSWLAL